MSSSKWSGKTMGNRYGYLFFVYSIKLLPLRLNYTFLRFVSYFYFLFAEKQKKALRSFYESVFPEASKQEIGQMVKNNFYNLAQSLVDRVAFLSKEKPGFEFEFNGHELLLETLEQGKGMVLLGSHLGNWEIAGEMIYEKGIKQKVNVVLVDNEKESVKELLEKVKRPNSFNLIAIKDDFTHIIKMKNALDRGEILCVLADRHLENTRTLELDFMQSKMNIPLGIFMFIEKFQAPTLFFYNFKTGEKNYRLEAVQSTSAFDSTEKAKEYLNVLGDKVLTYPEQFYNYHFILNK